MPKHGVTLAVELPPSRRDFSLDRQPTDRDTSGEDANGERRLAAAAHERPQRREIEREVEGETYRIEHVEAGALELVEPPLDNGVRRRTLEPGTNAWRGGCCTNHGPAIGSGRPRLELLLTF